MSCCVQTWTSWLLSWGKVNKTNFFWTKKYFIKMLFVGLWFQLLQCTARLMRLRAFTTQDQLVKREVVSCWLQFWVPFLELHCMIEQSLFCKELRMSLKHEIKKSWQFECVMWLLMLVLVLASLILLLRSSKNCVRADLLLQQVANVDDQKAVFVVFSDI